MTAVCFEELKVWVFGLDCGMRSWAHPFNLGTQVINLIAINKILNSSGSAAGDQAAQEHKVLNGWRVVWRKGWLCCIGDEDIELAQMIKEKSVCGWICVNLQEISWPGFRARLPRHSACCRGDPRTKISRGSRFTSAA